MHNRPRRKPWQLRQNTQNHSALCTLESKPWNSKPTRFKPCESVGIIHVVVLKSKIGTQLAKELDWNGTKSTQSKNSYHSKSRIEPPYQSSYISFFLACCSYELDAWLRILATSPSIEKINKLLPRDLSWQTNCFPIVKLFVFCSIPVQVLSDPSQVRDQISYHTHDVWICSLHIRTLG